jgi:phosphate transport system substrate-binding protein
MLHKLTRRLAAGSSLLCLAWAATGYAGEVNEISGAGATFPYPVYAKWAEAYHQATGVKLNYQSIGSGGGIKQIEAKTVDFGASDAPLQPQELDKAGLLQFPTGMGGVVPVLNIEGIEAGKLQISGAVLADIFLGKITKWNDPAIVKLNSATKLPDRAITVVHRADGSGTTWILTNYLSKVSEEWAERHGKSVLTRLRLEGPWAQAGVVGHTQIVEDEADVARQALERCGDGIAGLGLDGTDGEAA